MINSQQPERDRLGGRTSSSGTWAQAEIDGVNASRRTTRPPVPFPWLHVTSWRLFQDWCAKPTWSSQEIKPNHGATSVPLRLASHVSSSSSRVRNGEVWFACAGPFSRIPAVGSLVYYFPSGHADQCRGAHLDHPPPDDAVPCKVTEVELLYHATTGDPHAVITLLRDQGQAPPPVPDDRANPTERTAAVYFVKKLKESDNKSPFGVPKACCEALFPRFEPSTNQPPILDVHGKQMEFFYNISDRRKHGLTPKWGDYYREMGLKLKDAVVVMRRAGGGFLIGTRRGAPSTDLVQELVKDVVQAAASARGEMPFRVTYYPRQGWDFVVPKKQVDDAEAQALNWLQRGAKVSMACPVDDHELQSSRTRNKMPMSFNGFVRSVRNTNWCKLEIHWEGSEKSSPSRDVNVWQVQHIGDPSPEKQRKTSHDASASSSHRLEYDADRPSLKVPIVEEIDALLSQSNTMPGVASSSYMAGSSAAGVQDEGSHGGLHGEPSSSSTSSIKLFGVQITTGAVPGTDGQPGTNPRAKDDDKNKST